MFFHRFLVAGFLLIFTATVASAYTVVMRNGRRVEIPNTFTVTKSTLTYETAPGIQVTIQLQGIDIAATERMNRQPAGSLLANANAPVPTQAAPAPQTRRTQAARSITNRDLEVYRRARMEGEKERIELGLPTAEDRRREVEEIDERTQEQIRNMRSQEELDFWRSRAMELQAQMAANQAQINVMRNQVNDVPWAYPYGIGLVTSGFPFAFDGFGGHGFGFNKFGFNRFGFNGFNRHNFGFRGRLRFTPRPGFTTRPGGGGRGHGRR